MTLIPELLEEVYDSWAKDPQHLTKYALTMLLNACDSTSLACHQAITCASARRYWQRLGTTTADIRKREQQFIQLANALQKELDQL